MKYNKTSNGWKKECDHSLREKHKRTKVNWCNDKRIRLLLNTIELSMEISGEVIIHEDAN